MPSHDSRDMMQLYYPQRKQSPGCCGLGVLVVGVLVCLWLTLASPSPLRTLLSSKPLLTIPLPKVNGLVHAQPVAQSHSSPNDDAVTGAPSLRASFVDRVLARAQSPAAGLGQALYDLSVQYHIDDALALAFFQHESGFGTTGMARVTRSLGNIRCSSGYECINGYRAYQTWQEGFADWYHLIEDGYLQGHITIPLVGHVCTTISQIVPVYAPTSDGNNVAAYIAAVEQAVNGWRQEEGQG
jgi:Mannosyl-glycoprotein endo-beta-N-acetylglucosaminidase